MKELDILAQLGDMKEVDYRNTLTLASIIEILVDKGIIDRKDIAIKARELDSMTVDEIKIKRMK